MGVSWNRGYDVVLAVRSESITQLLAALHQSGSFPHSAWLNLPFTEVPPGSLPDGVLGLQISAPAISWADADAIDRLAIAFKLRARFQPREDSAPAPALVHGKLVVSATVGVDASGGDALISVDLDSPDATVEFFPAPNFPDLTSAEVQALEGTVRDLLANRFGPINHRMLLPELPGLAVRSLDVRTFSGGGGRLDSVDYTDPEATALVIDFREHQPEADELSKVTNPLRFADSETRRDLAVSINQAFLAETLTGLGASLLEGLRVTYKVNVWPLTFEFVCQATPSSLQVSLRDDGTIRAQVNGTIRGPLDYDLSLRQDLSVSVQNGALVIARAGNPKVTIDSWDFGLGIEKKIRDAAKPYLDSLAEQASAMVSGVLWNLQAMLLDSLGVSGAGLTLSRAQVDAEALRLLADFDPPALGPPVADWSFRQLVEEIDGTPQKVIELNAIHSWAPGGEITYFRWIWRRLPPGVHDPDAPAEKSGEKKLNHDFVYRLVEGDFDPDAPRWLDTEITLEVKARQPDSASADGYRTAYALHTGWIRKWDVESWPRHWDSVGLEIDSLNDRGEIVGRTTVPRSGRRSGPAYGSATLVEYDPDKATLEEVRRLLEPGGVIGERGGDMATLVVVSRETGEFAELRRSETRFGYAVDHDGSWAEMLGVERGQATVLFDGAGKEVWRHDGEVSAAVLARALRQHLPGIQATGTWKRVELAVKPGQAAPDFPIEHLGHQVGLRKFDQRGAALCFIKGWSDVCLEELRRLSDSRSDGGLVVAICDREDGVAAAAAVERLGIDVQIVADADRAITGRYGVSIWPTVVHVAPGGKISHIQMGVPDPALLTPLASAAAAVSPRGSQEPAVQVDRDAQ